MADGLNVTAGVGTRILTDEVTYSGDTVHLQGIGIFTVSGAEGGKIATAVSRTNPLPTRIPGAVSLLNSSTDTLDSNEEFVGGWDDVLDYEALTVAVSTDVDSAAGGLVIEQSPNNDGTDIVFSTAESASGGVLTNGVTVPCRAQYARVRYLNGPSAQVSFILTTNKKSVFSILNPVVGQQVKALSGPVVLASDSDAVDMNQFHHTEDSVTAYGKAYNSISVVLTANASTSGAPPTGNQIVAAPSAGNHLVIKYLAYTLLDTVATNVTVAIRAGTGGANQYTRTLTARADTKGRGELVTTELHLASATALYGNLSAALSNGGVSVDVEYETRTDS